jgi:hypothetical protein
MALRMPPFGCRIFEAPLHESSRRCLGAPTRDAAHKRNTPVAQLPPSRCVVHACGLSGSREAVGGCAAHARRHRADVRGVLGATVDDGRLPVRTPLPVYRVCASFYRRRGGVPDLPPAGHQRPRHLRRVIQQARADLGRALRPRHECLRL